MQGVIIEHGQIEYIDPQAFEGLAQWKDLLITSHKMTKALKITSDVSSLTELKIHNVARDFENMDLKPFIALKILLMFRGKLTNIPETVQYIRGTLSYLSLAHNHITTLDGMQNMTFEKLSALDLKHNKITKIKAQFLQFPVLQQINLSDNQLTQLEDLRFCTWGIRNDGVRSFEISGNPWHCNDRMVMLIKLLCRDRGFVYFRLKPTEIGFGLANMVCQSPADVKGEVFTSVFEVAIQEMDDCPGSKLLEAMILTDLITCQLLTHLPLVPHMCVSESDQYWFRSWFGAYSAPSHYLN